jgi:predicted nucleic acid-binding protein
VIGVDTSFLVSLTAQEHPSQEASLRVFNEEIQGHAGSMALSAQVLAEFCHVITDPRRFEHPLEMSDALDLCETWWNSAECRPVTVDAEGGALFLTWMHQFGLGRKRLLDTLLAASLYAAGVDRLVTTDWRDFEVYGVFELVRV